MKQPLATMVLPIVDKNHYYTEYIWDYGTLIVEAAIANVPTLTRDDTAEGDEIIFLIVRSSDRSRTFVRYDKSDSRKPLSQQNLHYLISGVKELVYAALSDAHHFQQDGANRLAEAINLLKPAK